MGSIDAARRAGRYEANNAVKNKIAEHEAFAVRLLMSIYRPTLAWVLKARFLVLGIAVASLVLMGVSSAAMGLLRLSQLTGNAEYERQALGVLSLLHEIAPRHPAAFAHALQALHWNFAPARPIACEVPSTGAIE